MGTKIKSRYVCDECGGQSSQMMGRCPHCGQWDTLRAEAIVEETSLSFKPDLEAVFPLPMSEIKGEEEERFSTGIGELDTVLGGGLVEGSFVLVGGEPGIGKSTLMMQVGQSLAGRGKKVLYVTGEESPQQVKMRSDRMEEKLNENSMENLFLYAETNLEKIAEAVKKVGPKIVVMDSIQTVFTSDIPAAPGSVSQVRECAARMMQWAKRGKMTVVLIGHVTKEGAIAGPRVLEHLVDAVLYFEGDFQKQYRILRSIKNRFGPAHEVGVFEMTSKGMKEIADPSGVLVSAPSNPVSGSIIFSAMEGSRPLLVELQALTARTSFPAPRRLASGLDYNRLLLVLAIIEKRGSIPLQNEDCFVNVGGGLRLHEPSSDLPVALAIVSSYFDRPFPRGTVAFGELGLGGEVRAGMYIQERLKECGKLGMKRVILPDLPKTKWEPYGMELIRVSTLREAIQQLRD